MRAAPHRPSGVERTFGAEEIIVSKTDAQGRIRYANDVFLRVSGYREVELLGQPHSIIRHPQMPRTIFRLLWQTIAAGEEMFAYVNNLASDGAHYWVLAHVTPSSRDGSGHHGYHSNRRCPDRAAVEAVDRLYRRLHTEEQRHARPAEAMAASGTLLESLLAARGLTYDEYVWQLVSGRPVEV